MIKKAYKFFKKNFFVIAIGVVLVAAFVIRVFNIDRLLGFYYDQGRDALVIWDLWHKGKFFLIGPTTGLAGIFRAPYYYYLIAPFYLIGNGNPLFPSVFLILTTVVSIYFLYYLASKFQDKPTGIITALIAAFSFNLVIAARWLSNPTPMLLLSMVLVFSMYKVAMGKMWGWPLIAGVSGLSLFSFGSAGELFYFPAILIFLVWQWKNRPNLKYTFISLSIFIITFLPLVIFDIKHDGILRSNMIKTFVSEKSFTLPTKYLFEKRTPFYYDVFTNKIFHSRGKNEISIFIATEVAFLLFLPKFLKNKGVVITILLLASPLVGLYFYQGNYSVLYDYYMTGYYLIFILLFGVVLGKVFQYKIGKILVIVFFYFFIQNNIEPLKTKLGDESLGPGSISFINQKQIIDWIYKDANGKTFNVDVYVPPVIPYAYDYLFTWYGGNKYKYVPDVNLDSLLYTVYELDTDHQERLDAWMNRQKDIGIVKEEFRSGAIIVERRERIWKK